MITEHDAKKRRCPMLGHEVAFSYCREPGSETPCRKIFDCWWETFDVSAFINDHYDAMGRCGEGREDIFQTLRCVNGLAVLQSRE